MSPKREADEAQPGTAAKKGKSAAEQALDKALEEKLAARSKRWAPVSASRNLDVHYWTMTKDPAEAYAWKTMCKPKTKHEPQEEEEEQEKAPKHDRGKSCPCNKSPDDLPFHLYFLSDAALYKQRLSRDMMGVRDPDVFVMYTFDDHASHGILEVVQNLLLDFDEAYEAQDWREAWVNVETLAMLFRYGGGKEMFMCNDVQVIQDVVEIVAKVPLAAIDAIQKQPESQASWQPRNVGWVMSMWRDISKSFEDAGLVTRTESSNSGAYKWNAGDLDGYLLSLASQGKITLLYGDEEGGIIVLPDLGEQDPWNWTKAFASYKKTTSSHPLGGRNTSGIGGDKLDITTWTPAERIKASFDAGKDPISPSQIKDLKEGMVLGLV